MLFRVLIKHIWTIFDVICYISAAVCINYGVFSINSKAGIISLGITFILFGLASEMPVESKGGDK